MDVLKAEIERKKRLIQEKNVLQPQKKYFKRGDLAAVQESEYLAKYGVQDKEEVQIQKKDELKKEEAKEEKEENLEAANLYPLPKEEVRRRLREMFQPIVVFGESDEAANRRLRSLVLEEGDSFKLSKSTNDFQEAMKSVDKQYLKLIQASDPQDKGKERLELKLYQTSRSYGDLQTLAMDLRRGNHKHDEMVVSEWIKVVMTIWGNELNKRPDDDKMCVRGKMESGTFTQTKNYIKPLLKMLKKGALSDDIRDSLSNMAKYVMHKDYILANEKYMEMAIGNAPWPIGVTNAGIHARPGRERIFSKHVAHVLNDESQRRWIQGLKRLLTKSQQYFPTDPSRMVEFIKADIRAQKGQEVEEEEKEEEKV